MYYRTKGFIIKKNDFKEGDEMITVYSEEFGKIDLVSRGAKKILAKLSPFLQLFNLVNLEFIEGKNFKTVTAAENINNFNHEKKNLFKLEILEKTSRLVDKLVIAPQKDEELWEFLLNFYSAIALIKLEDKESFEKLINFFETKIQKILGNL